LPGAVEEVGEKRKEIRLKRALHRIAELMKCFLVWFYWDFGFL
jgi:hypothetical protein